LTPAAAGFNAAARLPSVTDWPFSTLVVLYGKIRIAEQRALSLADIYNAKTYVRFSSKGGHVRCKSERPLRANSELLQYRLTSG